VSILKIGKNERPLRWSMEDADWERWIASRKGDQV
jgi:hypothetical protein